MTAQLLAIIAPTLLTSAIGFGWARLGHGFDAEFIRRFVFYVGGPALILSSLTSSQVDPSRLWQVGGMALAVWSLCLVIAASALKLGGRPLPVYLPPLIFGNQANMGVPLCMFAFGETGLVLGVAYFVSINLLHFTVGLFLVSHRNPLGQILRAPMLYATLLSAGIIALDIALPAWLANTLRLVGQATIPLMLLTLGASLAPSDPATWAARWDSARRAWHWVSPPACWWSPCWICRARCAAWCCFRPACPRPCSITCWHCSSGAHPRSAPASSSVPRC